MAKMECLFPPGRFVWGDLYTPQDKDAEGKPLVIKSGPNAGQPTTKFNFGVAIPKGAERHWAETQWGQVLWNAGHSGLATAGQLGDQFAWKVKDGDDPRPGRIRNGKPTPAPKDRKGYPGNWVVSFSTQFPCQLFTVLGSPKPVPFEQKGAINPGDYVQVYGTADYNGAANNPGLFLSPSVVVLCGYGERIVTGVDVSQIAFGGQMAGTSAVPLGGASVPGAIPGAAPAPAPAPGGYPPAPVPGAAPGGYAPPPVPGAAPAPAPAPGGYAPPPVPGAAPAPSAPVVPNASYMQPQAPAPAPVAAPPAYAPPPAAPAVPAPVAPPPSSGPVMTAKAAGVTYEQFLAQGWTDDMLRANGYMM